MRRKIAAILAVLLICLSLTACSSGVELSKITKQYDLDFTDAGVSIFFSSEMERGIEIFTTMTGDEAERFIMSLMISRPLKDPKAGYAVPLEATHLIRLQLASSRMCNFYYDSVQDWLVLEQSVSDRNGLRLEYRFYQPDESFHALLAMARKQAVSSDRQNNGELATSLLVLRASITADMLAEEGEEIITRVYTGNYAYVEAEPFYQVFTDADRDELGKNDAMIVAACGSKDREGYLIEITDVLRTDHIVKIVVALQEPYSEGDDDYEEITTYPFTVLLCDKDDIPEDFVIVFVNEQNEILGVDQI